MEIREETAMHPDFHQMVLHDNARELDRRVQAAYRRRAAEDTPAPAEDVALRLCSVRDDEALDRLALLEGKPLPKGRYVVAEVGGVVVAAHPLGAGLPLADPFRHTAHLRSLLELRAKQLARAEHRSRSLPLWGAIRAAGRA
jgi:hypothetical protein